jgi:primase-polymerase (primpol)-like protein
MNNSIESVPNLRLSDLNTSPVWVAWRNELIDGVVKKIPYSGKDRRAKSDDPATWITLAAAAELAPKIHNGHNGGIGIFLGIDCGHG